MARKKVKLAWITNDSARRATFKKRKKGLLKKVSELSTLCGVEAAAVIVGPYETQPDVWPSAMEAERVLLKFKTLPEMDQEKKMMNQEGFFKQRIEKMKEQVRKLAHENLDLEVDILMHQCFAGRGLEDLRFRELEEMLKRLDAKARVVEERIEKQMPGSNLGLWQLAPVATQQEQVINFAGSINRNMNEMVVAGENRGGSRKEKTALEAAMESLQRQQWFVDVMNPPHDRMVGEEMVVVPYGENTSWFDAFP